MPDVKPLPPEILADALQDRIFPTSGKLIDAQPIKLKKASDALWAGWTQKAP